MYRSNPFCSTKTPGLNMWKHLWTRKRENPKTRKREESTCGRENGENAKTAKTRKPRKRGKRENGENPKTRKRRKRPKVFLFSGFQFLVFSVFSVFWFSRFLVFSFRWPHPSGQVAFFMCLVNSISGMIRIQTRARSQGVVQGLRGNRLKTVVEAAGMAESRGARVLESS